MTAQARTIARMLATIAQAQAAQAEADRDAIRDAQAQAAQAEADRDAIRDAQAAAARAREAAADRARTLRRRAREAADREAGS